MANMFIGLSIGFGLGCFFLGAWYEYLYRNGARSGSRDTDKWTDIEWQELKNRSYRQDTKEDKDK